METISIEVSHVVGGEHCILEEDGARVASVVAAAMIDGQQVNLSFRGNQMLTTPFIRALFAPLLEQFPTEQLNARLQLTQLSKGDLARIKFILDDLKLRARDPEAYDRAREHALELA